MGGAAPNIHDVLCACADFALLRGFCLCGGGRYFTASQDHARAVQFASQLAGLLARHKESANQFEPVTHATQGRHANFSFRADRRQFDESLVLFQVETDDTDAAHCVVEGLRARVRPGEETVFTIQGNSTIRRRPPCCCLVQYPPHFWQL